MTATVVVTGATGFIGRALCPALRQAGYNVRAVVRKQQGRDDEATFVVGEVGPDTDWSGALRGADAVVHLAARAHILEREADALANFRRVNRDGTRRLAEASVAAGVKHFIYMSSVKAVAESTGMTPVTEGAIAKPASPYGISKREAEEAVERAAAGAPMRVVILRPPLVYGPGNVANMLRIFRAIDAGWPLPLASVKSRRSFIYLDNLVSAILAALDSSARGTFFISDGEDLGTPELISRLAAAMGRRVTLLPFPVPLLRFGSRLIGRGDDATRILGSLAVDSALFRERTGWRPPVTLEAGLQRTADWFRQETKSASELAVQGRRGE